MWVPARSARKIFATVLHVKQYEAYTMLSFVMGREKVTATKQEMQWKQWFVLGSSCCRTVSEVLEQGWEWLGFVLRCEGMEKLQS